MAEVKASVPVQNYNRAWPMWREKALARAKNLNAILMRVLMALTIILWAAILVSFFVPVPQQSGRPPTAARQ